MTHVYVRMHLFIDSYPLLNYGGHFSPRTSSLGTCCASLRTVTGGSGCGWSSPTSASSSTKHTRWMAVASRS
ncbi:hypothetical protein FKM82_024840 [Ascaphus truei]